MEKAKIMAVLAAVVIAMAALAVYSDGKKGVHADQGATGLATATLEAPVKEFAIESYTEIIDGKYYPKFSPNNITVLKGDRVRIKITATKGSHDFKIDEFGVYADTPLNKETVVDFTADKAGEFIYYCTKPGHRQAGHWGTLKVLE